VTPQGGPRRPSRDARSARQGRGRASAGQAGVRTSPCAGLCACRPCQRVGLVADSAGTPRPGVDPAGHRRPVGGVHHRAVQPGLVAFPLRLPCRCRSRRRGAGPGDAHRRRSPGLAARLGGPCTRPTPAVRVVAGAGRGAPRPGTRGSARPARTSALGPAADRRGRAILHTGPGDTAHRPRLPARPRAMPHGEGPPGGSAAGGA